MEAEVQGAARKARRVGRKKCLRNGGIGGESRG